MKTILIYRLGSVGDTVVALPCFHRIANFFPDTRRIVLTNHPVTSKTASLAAVLEHSGLIDGTINYETRERRVGSLARIRSEIRATGADTLVYLTDPLGRGRTGVLRDLLFFIFCGIRKIIGAPMAADLYNLRTDPTTGFVEYEAERLARCIQELGPINLASQRSWDLNLTQDERQAARAALLPLRGRKFIAVNIGGKVIEKDWGIDNWTALLRLLWPKIPNHALAFFGATDEQNYSATLAKIWPGASVNLCGALTPRESAAAMQSAEIFLGHDSGPMHLAASAGTPCIAIFGNYNIPRAWHPFGNQHRIIHNLTNIRAIRPEDVSAAVCDFLIKNALKKELP
jgi:ADP-heptose:LPS heptosyltransferase